jgi:hypothetical protein
MTQIADASGRPLSDVDLRPGDAPDTFVIVSAAAPEALMRHYFRGGRAEIILRVGERCVDGHIETRWERGARIWRIRLNAPLDLPGLESLSANAGAHRMRPLGNDPVGAQEAARPTGGS